MRKFKPLTFLLAAALLPGAAQAWWNKDWKQRTQIVLNTTTAGVTTQEAVSPFALPLRLHSGNFDFTSAKPDGSDLRVVAGDDKTPLKFWIERFDGVNELAVIWVQVPTVLPGTDKNLVYVYGGNDGAPAQPDDGAAVFDSATIASFHFAEKDGLAADLGGATKATTPTTIEPNGLIGPSARLGGTALVLPASDRLRATAAGPLSISLWIRPEAPRGTLYEQGALRIALDAGKVQVALGSLSLSGGDIPGAAWSHLALTLGGGNATLYVDGAQVARGALPAQAAPIQGEIRLGAGYSGLLDELELAASVRGADWVRLAHAAQAADAKLIASKGETADQADSEGGSPGYFGILIKNLTPDAWAVIGVLMVMFLIAAWVMVDKTLFVRRTERANGRFLPRFRDAVDLLDLGIDDPKVMRGSPLLRLYQAGAQQLQKRKVGVDGRTLSGAALDAVKAAIDADLVRETARLNSRMVLLTIAISGGPFLGLLGTVVGVMITFAAIAAAGDVNVNAIAPGIAAALLATVAGLAVAIPALFGYNYLAARIKLITSEMQIFVDEFVTRAAEVYGAP